MPIRNVMAWLQDYVQNYNLFIPDEDAYEDSHGESMDPMICIKQQKYSTWLYIFLFIIFLYVLFFIALANPQSRIVNVSDVTPFLFDQLYRQYGETLSCPCSVITVPYSTFVTNLVSFHQVCSSVFVSREWIEGLHIPIANAYMVADFRTTAFAQFELLADLCSISKDVVSQALATIDQYQFVTLQLMREKDVQTQVQATVELIRTTAPTQVTSFLRFLQMMYRSNNLVSAFGTNAIVYIGFWSVHMSSTYYTFSSSGNYNSSCAEKNSVTPAVLFTIPLLDDKVDHMYWPTYFDMFSRPLFSAIISGFFGGCFPLDAILASTLDCLYDAQCLAMLPSYFPVLNQSNYTRMNPLVGSAAGNVSVDTLVSQLFIDQLSTEINYTSYFHQCAPSTCTYSTTDLTNFSFALTLFLSLYGSLTAILRLFVPCLVKTVWKVRYRSITTCDCLSFIRNMAQWSKHLNVFKSMNHRTVNDIKQQRVSTYCLLVLLASSIGCFLLYTSLNTRVITSIEYNPLLIKYKQLQSLYADTLQCPCSNSAMSYERFVTLSPIFHQVCSSYFISDSWISILRNSKSPSPNIGTWMDYAPQYFNLLSSICHLANETTVNNVHDFLARTFVTLNVLIERDFETQLNTTIQQLIESIVVNFKLFINLTRIFIQADQPLTVLAHSQVTLNYIDAASADENPQSLQFTFAFNTIPNNMSKNGICQCVSDAQCQGSIDFATVDSSLVIIISLPGIYYPPRVSSYVAPGQVKGCYNSDSLFLSTLQCFYNDSGCMEQILRSINKTYSVSENAPSFNLSPLVYDQRSDRFLPNSSFLSILEEMMVEQWNISFSFPDYYQACAPSYCAYTQTQRGKSFVELMVSVLSMIGGLVIALQFITYQIVKITFHLFQRTKKVQQQRVRQKLSDRLKILVRNLITFSFRQMLNLNIFHARTFGSKVNQAMSKQLGQWSTRLYLILLLITLAILALHTVIQPETLTKTFLKPSLSFYRGLINDHRETLNCPCSLISLPCNEYVQIQPILHQVCSSDFVSNEWQSNVTANLQANLFAYNQRDYRRFLLGHLQFLRGLCQLSNQTLSQSIEQSLSSLLISKQLLSQEVFRLRIDSLINETKSNAPSTLRRLLSLLQDTNQGNAIVSSYGTNYQYMALTFTTYYTTLYTQAMIYDGNCSCQLNSTCTVQASFIEMNSTEPTTIKGLKMGCTPSASFLVSTLECFYDSLCTTLIERMASNYTSVHSTPLDPNNTRFAVNTTVLNLVNDLFVENWSVTINYSTYFDRCAPMFCSYTYIQQLNSLYTVTYLLGLYGGLTIILKWLSPKLVRFANTTYQCRRVYSNSVEPTSNIEIATVKTSIERHTNGIPELTQPKNRLSVSLNCLVFGSIVFILIAIVILIPAIHIIEQRKTYPTS